MTAPKLLVSSLVAVVLWCSASGDTLAVGQQPKPIVEVVIAGGGASAWTALTARLQQSWKRLNARMVSKVRPSLTPRDVLLTDTRAEIAMRVGLDLTKSNAAIVYVAEGGSVFQRDLKLGHGLDTVGLELLNVVVTSAVEAVLAGGHVAVTGKEFKRSLPLESSAIPGDGIGGSRADAPTPAPPLQQQPLQPPLQQPSQPPPTESTTGTRAAADARETPPSNATADVPRNEQLPSENTAPAPELPVIAQPANPPSSSGPPTVYGATILYEGLLLASRTAAHGLGLEGYTQVGSVRFGLWVQKHFSYHVAGYGESLSMASESAFLFVGRLLAQSPRWTCVLLLGAGVEVTHLRPASTRTDITSYSSFWTVAPVVRPLVRIERRFGGFSLGAILGVDVDVRGDAYIINADPTTRPVWTPWRARPLAALAMSYSW